MVQKGEGAYMSVKAGIRAVIVMMAFCFLPVAAQTGDSLCTYLWDSCNGNLKCITPSLWQDTTIVVPQTVTRIGKDGLRLCLADKVVNSGLPDIVYIVDMSGSMTGSTGSDPNGMRAPALQAGFKYQEDSLKGSYAGLIGFGTTVLTTAPAGFLYGHVQSMVDASTHKPILDTAVSHLAADMNSSGQGTNYKDPIDTAIKWLTSSTTSPHKSKAIIFISDGQPSPSYTAAQVNTLVANGIPVYGIFLGSAGGTALTNLDNATNGSTVVIPTGKTDTLAAVVKGIVKNIIKPFVFDSTSGYVSNDTLKDTVRVIASTSVSPGVWQVATADIIPLQPNANSISVMAKYKTSDGTSDTTLSFSFTLSVSGLVNSDSCYNCRPYSKLEILHLNTTRADTLSSTDNGFYLRLTNYDPWAPESSWAIVKTLAGDSERVLFTKPTKVGNQYVYLSQTSFSIVIPPVNATKLNGNVQARQLDIVSVKWTHPIDDRDTASAMAYVVAAPDSIGLFAAAGNPKTGIKKYKNPPLTDTLTAGTPANIFAKLFVDTTWMPSFENTSAAFTWTVTDLTTGLVDPALAATTITGSSMNITALKAWHTIRVTSSYTTTAGTKLTAEARFVVIPGKVMSLTIEKNGVRTLANENAKTPIDPIEIQASVSTDTVWGILRDSIGNWISPALATWRVDDSTVASVAVQADSSAKLTKGSKISGTTVLRANAYGFSDTAVIITDPYDIDSIYIAVNNGHLTRVDTVRMTDDIDTTCVLMGLRSDTKQWIEVGGTWNITGGLMANANLGFGTNMVILPVKPGTGTLSAVQGSLSTSITVIVLPGNPSKLVLVHTPTDTTASNPYGNIANPDTIVAGDTAALWANVYDSRGVLLSTYRLGGANAASIFWALGGTGSLKSANGAGNGATSTVAGRIMTVDAYIPGFTAADTAAIYVKAGPVAKISIESATDPLTLKATANEVSTVTIPGNIARSSVFAVLRDKFDNFVDFATSAGWVSRDDQVATVAGGNKLVGEGVITRIAFDDASTYVLASQNGFVDSVQVVILSAYYDSLRIEDASGNQLNSITVQNGSSTDLIAWGKRTDNGLWVPVAVTWHIDSTLKTTTTPPASANLWTVSPVNTGSGRIWITLGSAVPDTINAVFLPGNVASVVIFDATGTKQLSGTLDTIVAGDTLGMTAKLFDLNGNEIPVYPDTSYHWSDSASSIFTLTSIIGSESGITTTRAFATDAVIVAVGSIKADPVRLISVAGKVDHVVIEANPDKSFSPNFDAPLDTLVLTPKDTIGLVYAVLRDRFGNYVDPSTDNTWNIFDTTLARAENGSISIGQGFVYRVSDGITKLSLGSGIAGLVKSRDTCVVNILKYYYLSLRIDDSLMLPITDTLKASTSDIVTLYAEGLRSDTKKWEIVAVDWALDGSLRATPTAPSRQPHWIFTPDSTGQGHIMISMNNGVTVPDTIPAVFTIGDPTKLTLDILTPDSSLIAGQIIDGKLVLSNIAGVIPGITIADVKLSDLFTSDIVITAKGDTLVPVFIIGKDTVPFGSTLKNVTFIDGVAQVQMILYRVDSAGTSVVSTVSDIAWKNNLSDTTIVNIKPGVIARLVIADINGVPKDTGVILIPFGTHIQLTSRGYDLYGNYIGFVASDWMPDAKLAVQIPSVSASRIYYINPQIDTSCSGILTAYLSGDKTISDSASVRIIPRPATLLSAITRDNNGNGLLDTIEVTFDRPAAYFGELSPSDITVRDTISNLPLAVLKVAPSKADSSAFILTLDEGAAPDNPQTGLSPQLIFKENSFAANYDTLQCRDGAGPVIWRAYARPSDAVSGAQEVTIKMSEPFTGPNGDQFIRDGQTPPNTLVLSRFNGIDTLRDSTRLLGASFLSQSYDSANFVMAKDSLLTRNDFLSITMAQLVEDLSYNLPRANNRLCPVTIYDAPMVVKSGPNPMVVSTDTKSVSGFLGDSSDVIIVSQKIIKSGGTLVSAGITVPVEDGKISVGSCSGRFLVNDGIGNLVYSLTSSDIIPASWQNDTYYGSEVQQHITFFWNGHNSSGKPVSPGMYRVKLVISGGISKVATTVVIVAK